MPKTDAELKALEHKEKLKEILSKNEYGALFKFNIMKRPDDDPEVRKRQNALIHTIKNGAKTKPRDRNWNELLKRQTLKLLGDEYKNYYLRTLFQALPKTDRINAEGKPISLREFCALVEPSVYANAQTGEVSFEFNFNGYTAGFKLTLGSPSPQQMKYTPFIEDKRGEEPLPAAVKDSMLQSLLDFSHMAPSLTSSPQYKLATLNFKVEPVSFETPKIPVFVNIELKNSDGKLIREELPYRAFKDLSTLKEHLTELYSKHGRAEARGSADLKIILPDSQKINPKIKPIIQRTLHALRTETPATKWQCQLVIPKERLGRAPLGKPSTATVQSSEATGTDWRPEGTPAAPVTHAQALRRLGNSPVEGPVEGPVDPDGTKPSGPKRLSK
jgi:hypothetical protein